MTDAIHVAALSSVKQVWEIKVTDKQVNKASTNTAIINKLQ
jgi:hypothetical protein